MQAVSGIFLYYGCAVGPTILVSLNEIANKQSAPAPLTETVCNQLLDYLHAHPNDILRYYASDMIICLVSGAAYLVLPNARSRCATLFTLTNKPTTLPPNPTPNGPLHIMVKTIKGVPASASEAEIGGIFLGSQEACPIITALAKMVHPQPSNGTPLETENSTANDILTAQVRMKRSKAFDMRYHWIKDCIQQNQLNLYWVQGKLNRANYFTKHFPPVHHRQMRYQYLQKVPTLVSNCITSHARGCVPPSVPRRTIPRVTNVCPTVRDSLFSVH